MRPFTGDIQILLYTEEEKFSACRDFYQTLLRQEPYYSWNEGTQDCGAKFQAGRGTISVLCQAHDGKVEIVGEPVTQSYGTRYFTVKDPCGNRINLYHSNH